jgi:hypothetical protein
MDMQTYYDMLRKAVAENARQREEDAKNKEKPETSSSSHRDHN